MQKYFEILRRCALFAGIADEDLLVLLDCLGARLARYSKNQTVFAEGDPAQSIGILLSGSVQITRVDYFGNRSILTAVRPSELFGEAFACAGAASIPVSVVANADSEILLIDCARITQPCSNACGFHSQMIYNLMKTMATKNIQLQQRIEVTSQRTTRDKLMTYLLLQAQKTGKSRFDIPFDRQALADYLEVDRSGLSAEIGKLRKEGILNCRKNHFELL